MNRWHWDGLNGFSIVLDRDRKVEIGSSNTTLVDIIKSSITPQNLNTFCQELNQSNGMTKSRRVGFLKKLAYSYRRFGKYIKKCQDPIGYKELVEQLCQILLLQEQGYLKVYYGE